MSYTTIPALQDGSAKNPYLVSGAPSTSPGYAANVHATAYDSTNGVWYIKFGTLDTDWKPISGALSYPNDESYYKARARTLMGSPRLTCWWWDDFLEPLGESWTSIAGALSSVATKYDPCGVVSINAGTKGGSAGLYLGGAADQPGCFFPSGTSGVFYMAHKAKLNTEAACMTFLSMRRPSVFMIDYGNVSTASLNWGVRDGGTVTVGTVANDGAAHLHELVRYGGTTTYYLDEAPMMSGNWFPTTAALAILYSEMFTGYTNTTTFNVDFVALAVGGNNPRTIA